ncbi:MAG: hypothetical protein IJ782_07290 [Prevotella sp.]|nr:hypothetical protein [Prevotella sp.]
MKKFYNFMALALVAMLTLTLTSCNDDGYIADTLDGIWEGEVSQNYSWRWTNYSRYQYVDMEFITDPYKYAQGYGYEYDYYSDGYERVRFHFEVRNEVIYIDYADGVHVCIPKHNYTLTRNRFSGEFRDYYTGEYLGSFSFVKYTDYRYNRVYYPYSKEIDFEENK